MAFKSFEEIEAWKDARELSKMIRDVCKRDLVRKDYGWADQITRASISIMANIAEGFESQTDIEFATFAGYAKRSSAEVRSLLYYGLDQSYVSKNEFDIAASITQKICAGLSNLILYLRKSKRKVRATSQF